MHASLQQRKFVNICADHTATAEHLDVLPAVACLSQNAVQSSMFLSPQPHDSRLGTAMLAMVPRAAKDRTLLRQLVPTRSHLLSLSQSIPLDNPIPLRPSPLGPRLDSWGFKRLTQRRGATARLGRLKTRSAFRRFPLPVGAVVLLWVTPSMLG